MALGRSLFAALDDGVLSGAERRGLSELRRRQLAAATARARRSLALDDPQAVIGAG